jgi:hypothetical protein
MNFLFHISSVILDDTEFPFDIARVSGYTQRCLPDVGVVTAHDLIPICHYTHLTQRAGW